eukprot:TRINITY_DN67664_c11_g14_i1.p1 TRINITY_DN67664_c11_g14~~TRINITY_DN67664_c11_g14_i1.p1  ORF type:complete len:295 (+),score=65.66 TRINITY_DN67664_c11_g14_i1:35-886(+)
MTTFADLYKPVKDFFGKNFVSDNRVDLTAKNDGAKFAAFMEQKKDTCSGELSLENSVDVGSQPVKFKFTSNSGGRCIVKLTTSPSAIKGLEVNGQADMDIAAAGDNYDVDATYKKDKVAITAAMKNGKGKSVLDGSASVGICPKGLSVGGSGSYSLKSSKLETFSYGAQYGTKGQSFGFVVTDNKKMKAGCTVDTTSNGNPVTIGAEVVNNLTADPAVDTFTVGVQTKLSDQLVKAKLNQKGALNLALQTTFGKGAKATFGVGTNVKQMNGINAAVKLELGEA